MKKLLPLLVVLGCVAPAPRSTVPRPEVLDLRPRPGQEEATRIVWSALTDGGRVPPTVEWRSGAGLTCHQGTGFWVITDNRLTCVWGVYVPFAHLAIVAWHGGRISATSFAHELCHAAIGDAEHRICARDGKPQIIGALNELLAARGL